MAATESTSSRKAAAKARPGTSPDGPFEELYTPIEAAIDKEAEKTVCSECNPPSRNPIVSINGQDVDESGPDSGGKKAA